MLALAHDSSLFPTMTLLDDDDRRFKCSVPDCTKRFKRKFTLQEHEKTHAGVRPFQCLRDDCRRIFSTSGNLARHALTHSGETPFACGWNACVKAFCTREKLVRHLKTHAGLRPYVCKVCTKGFTTSGNLARHTKSHPPDVVADALQRDAMDAILLALETPPADPTNKSKRKTTYELATPTPWTPQPVVAPAGGFALSPPAQPVTWTMYGQPDLSLEVLDLDTDLSRLCFPPLPAVPFHAGHDLHGPSCFCV